MDIGFIGLGHMGSAIVRRLLQAKHTVRVWNRSPQAARKLEKDGAQVVDRPDEACAGDAVFSMLGDDNALRAVFQESGLLDRVSGATVPVHVNMATVSVALAEEFAESHAKRGIDYVAAPVLGRPDAAAAGKLNIIAAGPVAAIDRVQPLLDVVGQKTWRFGERASRANVVKIAMNFMLAAACESMGEAAALASGYDISPGDLFDLASHTMFAGPVYEGYGRLIAAGAFEPAGVGQQHPRLPQHIQRDVGQRQVFLQHRRMASPFGQPLAVDETAVRKTQDVGGLGIHGHHIWFSSSGSS